MFMSSKSYAQAAVFTLLVISANAAQSDDVIYKYRMSDGGIAYTQERSGSGELEDVLRVPSMPKSKSEKLARQELLKDKLKAARLAAQRQAEEQRQNQVIQAAENLTIARQVLANNLEPLPDERQGTVGGNTRLTEDYWERIEAMHQSVEIAQERLEDARERSPTR
jgi:hypothetical protein